MNTFDNINSSVNSVSIGGNKVAIATVPTDGNEPGSVKVYDVNGELTWFD